MAELPLPAGLNASTFPAKLWRLANSPRVRSVRWDTQGQGLLIDRALFEQELLSPAGADGAGGEGGAALPDSFKATHFGSVVRQLNLYGFQKVLGWFGAAVPGDAGAVVHFKNPNFRRDRPDLLLRIKRLTRANRQRLAAGLEVRSRQPSRFQQLNTERPLLHFPAGHPPGAGETGWELRA
ncbi:heat shock factor protein 5-like [Aphelocoma coerulescens]|uniref:heat shock factor protein 5-like n=1 Tax=Aphelocoma coerulescens TaxID=39617 RepID=UPI003604EEF5